MQNIGYHSHGVGLLDPEQHDISGRLFGPYDPEDGEYLCEICKRELTNGEVDDGHCLICTEEAES